MLRTVLAVLLALSLFGVSVPVIDSARVTHADESVHRTLQRLDSAATTVAATSDPVPPGTTGARRQHTLHLPRKSWASAGLARLEIPPLGSDNRLTWRVEGGNRSVFAPSIPIVGPPGGLTLEDGGNQRVVLRLRRLNGREVVVVTRPGV